jgi:hypothetical protein
MRGLRMNNATIQVRTAPEIKTASDTIFNKLGITMSDAINIFCGKQFYITDFRLNYVFHAITTQPLKPCRILKTQ